MMLKQKVVVGVDPGSSGGIAVLSDDCLQAIELLPIDENSTPLVIRHILDTYQPLLWAVERQIPFCSTGGSMGVTSAFTLGQNYGKILGALTVYREVVILVLPQEWQKGLPLPPQRADRKEKLIHMAMDAWPAVTDGPGWPKQKCLKSGLADACFIARHGYRKYCF